jgi:predicted nuclease with TOPRIM domain
MGAGLIALVVGVIQQWLGKDKEILTQGRALRDELRTELARIKVDYKELTDRVTRLEVELDQKTNSLNLLRARFNALSAAYQHQLEDSARLREYTVSMLVRYNITPEPDIIRLLEKREPIIDWEAFDRQARREVEEEDSGREPKSVSVRN